MFTCIDACCQCLSNGQPVLAPFRWLQALLPCLTLYQLIHRVVVKPCAAQYGEMMLKFAKGGLDLISISRVTSY